MLFLTDKIKSVLKISLTARLLTMEGSIRSSKTVCAIQAFALRVLSSPNLTHLIAAKDGDAIENNILNSNGFGLCYLYPELFKVTKEKIGGYFIEYQNLNNERGKILLTGYDKANSWKKILGSTLGCILVDEVNIADSTFIDECFSRQASALDPFTIWTMNGDSPEAEIYKKINQCEIYGTAPAMIVKEMSGVAKQNNWYYTHWDMKDNPAMSDEKIKAITSIYPVNSYYYNIKVLGIRGRAEGSIFAQQLDNTYIKSINYFTDEKGISNWTDGKDDYFFIGYSIGLDVGNNELKRGTVLTISGITDKKQAVELKSLECKSTEINALIDEIADFVYLFYSPLKHKDKIRGMFCDSYGPIQLMMSTLRKKFQSKGMLFPVQLVDKFGKDEGRKARLDLMMILVGAHRIIFNDRRYIELMGKLYYDDDGLPHDDNQKENDYYDSLCYSLSPFMLQLNFTI